MGAGMGREVVHEREVLFVCLMEGGIAEDQVEWTVVGQWGTGEIVGNHLGIWQCRSGAFDGE